MAEELLLSYVPGEGSPEGFYRGLGFEPTGEVDEGEVVMLGEVPDDVALVERAARRLVG